jgi:hypothetical protein
MDEPGSLELITGESFTIAPGEDWSLYLENLREAFDNDHDATHESQLYYGANRRPHLE